MRLLITSLTICSIVYAQETFCKTITGSFEVAKSIVKTPDGGYLIAGFTRTYGIGQEDGIVIKLKSDFSIDWIRTAGTSNREEFVRIKPLSSGKYIVVGNFLYTGRNWDFRTAMVDLSTWPYVTGPIYDIGDTISTGLDPDEIAYDIIEANNGYIIVGEYWTGSTGGDIYIVKVDIIFDVLWRIAVTSPGSGSEWANSIIKTNDGNYVAVGHFDIGLFMVKIDENGNFLWMRNYNNLYYYSDILEESDGSLVVASECNWPTDICISKFNSNGNWIWTKYVSGGSLIERPYRIIKTLDGGYLVVGETQSFGSGSNGSSDGYIVKFDNNGNVQWTRTVGSSSTYDQLYDVVQTPDSGYLAVGRMGTNMLIVKLDKNGNLCSPCNTGSGGSTASLTATSYNPSYTVFNPTIYSIPSGFSSNQPNINFTPICASTVISELENASVYISCKKDRIIMRSDKSFNFSAKIYNLSGILISSYNGTINNEFHLNTSHLKKGVYVLDIELNNKKIRKSFIKEE